MLRGRSILVVVAFAISAACAVACAPHQEEDAATSESQLTEGDAVVNVDALNLRSGPSTSDAVLVVMMQGARVKVTGATTDGFAPVTYGELRGWAWAEYLTSVTPVAIGTLEDAVHELAGEAGARSPGTQLAVSVLNLTTGAYAGANDDERHVSASSAKVLWVAAAMHAGAQVADIAPAIFRDSNNELSGTAIDRAGGPDAVNAFLWDVVGMDKTILANWSFGRSRRASNQGQLGGDNYFTTRDLMTFFAKLDGGALLGARTSELQGYMKLAPDAGIGGSLPALLPEAVRPEVMHKGGWLPPGCCSNDGLYNTLNDVGVVQVPGGDRYAVAILARRGTDYWGAQRSLVERASCVIYRTVAHDATLACVR